MSDAKEAARAAFCRDPRRLLDALGLQVDEKRHDSKRIWLFRPGEREASVAVTLDGEHAGTFYDHGRKLGGDAFDLAKTYGGAADFPAALARVCEVYGVDASDSPRQEPKAKHTVYPVRDAQGNVIAEHHREDGPRGKKMWWRRDGVNNLGGLSPSVLPLYRLPELLEQAPGNLVIVTEGERATDAVRAAGHAAVGTYGTGADPSEEVLQPLVPYVCLLWPDNDEPGEKHMAQIADRLLGLGAAVFRVNWTDAPQKGDAANATPEQIAALIAGAEEWGPGAGEQPQWTSADILGERVGAVTWLWPGWIPFGFLTVLGADAGDGKSALALEFCGRVLTGAQWPDGQPGQPSTAPVLVLDSEGCQAIWVDRIRSWGLPADRILFPGTGFERILLDDMDAIKAIRRTVKAQAVRLLIIDSFRQSLPPEISDSDSKCGPLLQPWADMARDLNFALLIVHHFSKPLQHAPRASSLHSLRGSGTIGAVARSVLVIDRPQDEPRDEDPRMRLACAKSNLGPLPEPIGFVVGSAGVEWCEAPEPPRDKRAPRRAEAREFLRRELERGAVQSGVLRDRAAAEGIAKDALYRAKEAMRIVDIPDEGDPNGRRVLWGLPVRQGDRSGWK